MTTTNSKPIYLSGLNGLRAIACIAVILSHITLRLDQFGLNNKIAGVDINGNARGLDLAGYGVTIFFTLSGFLITYLLLKEKEIQALKIKDFYIRRALRIWPLYYLYLIVSIIIGLIFGIPFFVSSIPFYIFLSANIPFILGNAIPFLAHYWSIGVEEQFYLFFPHLAKLNNEKFLKVSVYLLLFLILLKGYFWVCMRKYDIQLPFLAINVIRFHMMLIGVITAILYYNNNQKFIRIASNKITQITCWFCIFLIALNKFHIASVIDGEIVSIITALIIIGQINIKNRIINLENRICNFMGKISYGTYVIHPLIILLFSKIIGKFTTNYIWNYLFIYFIVIFFTVITAYISYEFYEKKFLKLKTKFTTVKSSNFAYPKAGQQ